MSRRASSRSQAAGSRPGHTLWEVLLVLALLASVGALVAPALADRRAGGTSDDTSLLTRDITALLARARRIALERGITVELILDARSARVWTFAHGGDDVRLIATSSIEYPRGVAIMTEAPRARFVFRPNGAASGDRLVVRTAGTSRLISVDPWTGATHVAAR